MIKKVVLTLAIALIGGVMSTVPASAGSWCNDGTYSSNSGRGSCSWHGGVNNRFPSYSDPGSSSWNRNNGWSNPFDYGRSSGSRWNNPFDSGRSSSWNNPFGSSRSTYCYTVKDWLGRTKKVCN